MLIRRALFAVGVVVGMVAGGSAPVQTPSAAEMSAFVGTIRKAEGGPPIAHSRELAKAAQRVADACAKGHLTLLGAVLPFESGMSDRPASLQDAVEIWIDSPGHLAELVDPVYGRVGVGVAYSPRGWYVFAVLGE